MNTHLKELELMSSKPISESQITYKLPTPVEFFEKWITINNNNKNLMELIKKLKKIFLKNTEKQEINLENDEADHYVREIALLFVQMTCYTSFESFSEGCKNWNTCFQNYIIYINLHKVVINAIAIEREKLIRDIKKNATEIYQNMAIGQYQKLQLRQQYEEQLMQQYEEQLMQQYEELKLRQQNQIQQYKTIEIEKPSRLYNISLEIKKRVIKDLTNIILPTDDDALKNSINVFIQYLIEEIHLFNTKSAIYYFDKYLTWFKTEYNKRFNINGEKINNEDVNLYKGTTWIMLDFYNNTFIKEYSQIFKLYDVYDEIFKLYDEIWKIYISLVFIVLNNIKYNAYGFNSNSGGSVFNKYKNRKSKKSHKHRKTKKLYKSLKSLKSRKSRKSRKLNKDRHSNWK